MQPIWPQGAKTFEVEGSTVPFIVYEEDGVRVIGFDSSSCVPPEPMVNAMLALKCITDANTKVVMINHKNPVGLLAKIGEDFHVVTENLENNLVRLSFTHKEGTNPHLSNANCAG